MSLEKWIKPQKEKDETKKELKEKKKESKSKNLQSEISTKKEVRPKDEFAKKYSKFLLVCSKKSCGYQKTLLKQQLKDKDKICPRCKGNMKIKKK